MEIREAKPRVKLIAYTKTIDGRGPEAVVASAAKLCYSKSDASTILNKSNDETDATFIEKLNSLGHFSPYEHAYFTFAIDGISRACSHQLVRHRIASYSQQSQRYVDLSDTFSVIVPDEVKNNPEAYQTFMESIKRDIEDYKIIKEELESKYNKTDDSNRKASIKKAIEDARYLLPNACETKIVMTMNARSLDNFFKERCCNRAQTEIRTLAYMMLDEVKEVAPDLFINAGAPCIKGPCPEGTMSCGHPYKRLVKKGDNNER